MGVPLKDSALIVMAAATLVVNTVSNTFDLAMGGLLVAGQFKPNQGGLAMTMVIPVQSFNAAATITLSNANGGTGAITVSNTGGSPTTPGSTQTAAGIAYNATAAAVQAAIQVLPNVGAGNATVSGGAGGPYTVVYNSSLGVVTTTASAVNLTGTAPAIAVSVPSYSFLVQSSSDGVTWTPISRAATVTGDSIMPAGGVMLIEFSVKDRYVQLVSTISGNNPSITIYDAYLSPSVNRF